jgi:hypothetical protein
MAGRHAKGQKVRIQNRYATAEYDSLDAAAYWLSTIGVKTQEEIRRLLGKREKYINGFSVTYPES